MYQLVKFQALLYVIDPDGVVPDQPSIPINEVGMSQLVFARANLDYLLAEIELNVITSVHIVYNVRKTSPLYHLRNDDATRQHYDRQIELEDLKQSRPDCMFSSYLIDVLEDR